MSALDLSIVARRVLDRVVFIATAAAYPPCRDPSSSSEERELFRFSYWTTASHLDQAIQLALGICPFAQPSLPASAACLGEELVESLRLTASSEASLFPSQQADSSSSTSTAPWVSSRLNTLAVQFIAWEIGRRVTTSADPATPPSSGVSPPSSDSLANVSTESPASSIGSSQSENDS